MPHWEGHPIHQGLDEKGRVRRDLSLGQAEEDDLDPFLLGREWVRLNGFGARLSGAQV